MVGRDAEELVAGEARHEGGGRVGVDLGDEDRDGGGAEREARDRPALLGLVGLELLEHLGLGEGGGERGHRAAGEARGIRDLAACARPRAHDVLEDERQVVPPHVAGDEAGPRHPLRPCA